MTAARGGALVTGAGRGLGQQLTILLAARGFTVHVTDLDGEAAGRTASDLGGRAFGSALDVRDEAACAAAAAATVERAGSLDVWVNNAGVLVTGPAWEQDAAHPGLVAAAGETVYSASKHAALAFSLGTAMDLRLAGVRGVDISCVCPDGIWTPMLFDKLHDPAAALSFQGTLLQPADVVRAVGRVLDRPRPVTSVPRSRGLQVRAFDAWPGLAVRLVPLVTALARRGQRRYARRLGPGG